MQEIIRKDKNASLQVGFMALVDCNSFYCSCERLFRPDLNEKPVVVLSNNDGCIISRTDEAKKLGVGMAGPYFLAKPLIEKNNVATFSSNYNLYGDLSWRVMETLRQIVGPHNVEVYSVDEAFVNLGQMNDIRLQQTALQLRETVERWTGIAVSVGVGPTKVLAKIANRLSKKDKKQSNCVMVLNTPEKIQLALQQTRVTDIWGIGRAYADKLINWGITSAWDVRNMPAEWATKNMGGVTGIRLWKELNEERAIVMEDELISKKMIATTRMFGEAVNNIEDVKEAIATYTARAAEKLRRQYSSARIISVFIVPKSQSHDTDFRHGHAISKYIILPVATSATNELIKPALKLVEQLFREGTFYKKAGVMLSGLEPDNAIQANMFVPERTNAKRQLMNMIDNVNFSMRDDMIKFASSGTKRNWKMRQDMRSNRYTSRWAELCEVS